MARSLLNVADKSRQEVETIVNKAFQAFFLQDGWQCGRNAPQ